MNSPESMFSPIGLPPRMRPVGDSSSLGAMRRHAEHAASRRLRLERRDPCPGNEISIFRTLLPSFQTRFVPHPRGNPFLHLSETAPQRGAAAAPGTRQFDPQRGGKRKPPGKTPLRNPNQLPPGSPRESPVSILESVLAKGRRPATRCGSRSRSIGSIRGRARGFRSGGIRPAEVRMPSDTISELLAGIRPARMFIL